MAMRIVKWSGRAKTDFSSILGFLYHNWSEKEAQNYIDEVKRLTTILEKGNVEFRKTRYAKIHVAVISEHNSIYYRILSKTRIEIVRIWDNRQNPKELFK